MSYKYKVVGKYGTAEHQELEINKAASMGYRIVRVDERWVYMEAALPKASTGPK